MKTYQKTEEFRIDKVALFIDVENHGTDFDIKKLIKVMEERKGKITIKRAYGDWKVNSQMKGNLHTNGVSLIEMPMNYIGKNSADIRLTVDALEIAITNDQVGTFIIVSSDSDFTPLFTKLWEYNKEVIVIGKKNQTSKTIIDGGFCNEFIYYSNLVNKNIEQNVNEENLDIIDENSDEFDIESAYKILIKAVKQIQNEGKTQINLSYLKDKMLTIDPLFNEFNYKYVQFSKFIEYAKRNEIITFQINNLLYEISLFQKASNSQNNIIDKKPAKTKKLPFDLTNIILWAIEINKIAREKYLEPLGRNTQINKMVFEYIAPIIRSLDESFSFTKYGYSNKKRWMPIIEDIKHDQYISYEFNPNNQLEIILTEEYLNFIKNNKSSKPVSFDKLVNYRIQIMKRASLRD
jgi:uncharacterized protein (TIGR00288 family)